MVWCTINADEKFAQSLHCWIQFQFPVHSEVCRSLFILWVYAKINKPLLYSILSYCWTLWYANRQWPPCLISIMETAKCIQVWGYLSVWYIHVPSHSVQAHVSSEALCRSTRSLISNILPGNTLDLLLLLLRGTFIPGRMSIGSDTTSSP